MTKENKISSLSIFLIIFAIIVVIVSGVLLGIYLPKTQKNITYSCDKSKHVCVEEKNGAGDYKNLTNCNNNCTTPKPMIQEQKKEQAEETTSIESNIEPETGYSCMLSSYGYGGLRCTETDISKAQYPNLESCQNNCINTKYIERPLLYNYRPGYWGWFGRRRPIWPPRFPRRRRGRGL